MQILLRLPWQIVHYNILKVKTNKTARKIDNEEKLRLRLIKDFERYIDYHDDYIIDWSDNTQRKYYIIYDAKANALLFDNYTTSLKREGTHYVSDPEILIEYVNTIGEDNFKKYILRL